MASEYIRRPGSARAAKFKGDPDSALEVASLLANQPFKAVVTIEGPNGNAGQIADLIADLSSALKRNMETYMAALTRFDLNTQAALIDRAEEVLKELKPEEEEPEEEPIAGHVWACPSCRSTVLCRDASVLVNDPDEEPNIYDSVSCADCGYDGNRYLKVPMTESELDALIMEPTLTEEKVEGLGVEHI